MYLENIYNVISLKMSFTPKIMFEHNCDCMYIINM